MKYRQICILGTAGVLSNLQESAAVQINRIKLKSHEHQLVQLKQNVDEDDSLTLDGSDIKAKNIYGIPDDDERQQALSQKQKKVNAEKLIKKKASLKEAFNKFSRTLTEKDFDDAV